jgi:hypothetical protein
VLVHIQNRVRTDKHIGRYISVTSLLGCLRQLYLERTIEYFVEPPKSWWSLRGSILHRLLENPGFEALIDDVRKEVYRGFKVVDNRADLEQRWIEIEAQLADFASLLPRRDIPNWESETEYEMPIGILDDNGNEMFLRGTIDVLRPESGELYDYKTIGDRGLAVIKDGAKDDHIMQFNMYRLLVERGWPVGQRDTYRPITINKIVAFYMTMMQIARTGGLMTEVTDWRLSDPPDHQSRVGFERLAAKEKLVLRRGRKTANATPDDFELKEFSKFRVTYAVPDVPLMPLDDVFKFVQETVPILTRAFNKGEMPPMCPPKMRQWKCEGYCPDQIRNTCDKFNDSVGERRIVEEEDTSIPVEAV